MQTHGRQVLYSTLNEEELDEDTILQALVELKPLHETNKIESKYLRDYYVGIQDIDEKKKTYREEINNKLTENWAYCITEFVKSFLLNEPIQYVQRDDEATAEIVTLNNYVAYENKAAKDSDIVEDIVLTGRGFRYVAPDIVFEEDEAPFEIENIKPENCEIVYNSGIGHKQLFAVVETPLVKNALVINDTGIEEMQEQHYSIYTIYTKNRVFTYTDENGELEKVEKEETYLFPEGHRIIEYYFNKSRFSLLEAVKPILDKLNYLESLDMDDMEQFVNALMIFKNANITAETIEEGKKLGAILLKSDTSLPADAELLQGRLKAADTQVFYQRLIQAALSIIAMPFATDNGSYGDTGIARMTGQGWTMADQRTIPLLSSMVMSERELLKYILKICKNKTNSGIATLKASNVEIRFRINKNANILEKTQALLNMKMAKISPSIAIPTCKIFSDDQNAIMESKKYFGEDFWKEEKEETKEQQQIEDIEEQNNEVQDIKETAKQKGV